MHSDIESVDREWREKIVLVKRLAKNGTFCKSQD